MIKTGPVDHGDWHFLPLIGWITRLRSKAFISLLPKHQIHRLLEIGYGSGVLMPELTRYCDELYGIDIHPKQQEVNDILMRFKVTAKLFSRSAEDMPFGEDFLTAW